MSNGLFIGDKDPVEIRVGSKKATSVYYSGDNVPQNPVLHISAKGLTTAGIAQSGGVVDRSGNGNNGTAYGGVEVVNDSEMGECFSFEKNKKEALCFDNTVDWSKPFSVSLWIKASDLSQVPCLFDSRMSTNNSNFFFGTVDTSDYRIRFITRNSSTSFTYYSAKTLALNKVINIIVTVENYVLKIYFNGALDSTRNLNSLSVFNQKNFYIGGFRNYDTVADRTFTGLISEVKIFPYALTSEQVQALYRGIKKVWSNVPDGAILHLNAKGLTTEGIKQTDGIPDLSGNGNNATGIANISIVQDDDLGECFDFNNGCIDGNLTFYKTLSVAFTLKRTGNGRPYGAIWLSNQKDYGYLQISISSDTLYVRIFDGSNLDYSYVTRLELPNPDIGEYHHYAFTVDATNKKLGIYIDGTLYQEVPFAKNYGYNKVTEPLTSYRIGRLSSTYYTQIRIQNFFVYPRALTAHEVKKLYRASKK